MALYVGARAVLERGQGYYLATGGLLGTHPISSHFTPFPYVTSAPLSAALVVIPRVGGFAYVLGLCGPFKQNLLRDRQFLLQPQPPTGFEVMRLYEALRL